MASSFKLKTCIIGNQSVGKTSLIVRIHQDKFTGQTVPTSGVDYNSKKTKINEEETIIQLWDTTGQDRFRNVVSNFFRGADGIFLTFDMTNEKSLVELQIWIKQLNAVLEQEVPKVILGNKSDLKSFLTPDEQKTVEKYLEDNKNMKFYKVSAKSGQGIEQAYNFLVQQAYTYSYSKRKGRTVPVIIKPDKKKKKGCC